MSICLYCGKNDGQVTFGGREHVIPRMMGSFENSPTLIGFVCDECNSQIFSALETRFKEDTEEGLYLQMHDFGKAMQVRIRGNNLKLKASSGTMGDLFDLIFHFFVYQDGMWKVVPRSQIQIKSRDGVGLTILLFDEVRKLNRSSRKFFRLRNLVSSAESKNINIFTLEEKPDDDKNHAEAMELIKELGVEYKQGTKKTESIENEALPQKEFVMNLQATVGRDSARVIAKIAFNYFTHCAIKSGKPDAPYRQNFSRIRSYIAGQVELPVREVITEISDSTIVLDEVEAGGRVPWHTVTFSEEGGHVVARVSFVGRKTYTVDLGPIPEDLRSESFGCGHIFNPIGHKIHGLTQNSVLRGTMQERGFGLYNRI